MSQTDARSLAGRLKAIRSERGLSQMDFAKALGVHYKSYAAYESGDRSAPLEIVCQLVDEGIAANWLIRGQGPQSEQSLRDAISRSSVALDEALQSLKLKVTSAKRGELLAELTLRSLGSAHPQEVLSLVRLVAA